MWNWLLKEENRKTLSWLGGGLVVVVVGLWNAYIYFDKARRRPLLSQGAGELRVSRRGLDLRYFSG